MHPGELGVDAPPRQPGASFGDAHEEQGEPAQQDVGADAGFDAVEHGAQLEGGLEVSEPSFGLEQVRVAQREVAGGEVGVRGGQPSAEEGADCVSRSTPRSRAPGADDDPALGRSNPRRGSRLDRWRDWRTYVAAAGRIFLSLGVLLLAFVAYQLWGTGIQEARAQHELRTRFDEVLSSTVPSTVPSASVAPAPTSAPMVRPSTGTLPPPRATEPSPTVRSPGEPPSHPEIKDGDPVARLQIPAISLDKVVVSGVDPGDLRRGPGHYVATPLPGEVGNAGIAGHRTTSGAPFGDLDKLQAGDEIIATTPAGRFRYLVVRTKIVSPNDASVLAPSTDVRLTLTTCNPRYSTAQRLIVTAVLDQQSGNHPLATTAPTPPSTPPPITPVTTARVTTVPGASTT